MNSENFLQIGLSILTWLFGFFTAVLVSQMRRRKERTILIRILKKELDAIEETVNNKIISEERAPAQAPDEEVFVTSYPVDYIDWTLNSTNLFLKKDQSLIKTLVKAKAVTTNFNQAVFMWNLGTLKDFNVIKRFRSQADEMLRQLKNEIEDDQ